MGLVEQSYNQLSLFRSVRDIHTDSKKIHYVTKQFCTDMKLGRGYFESQEMFLVSLGTLFEDTDLLKKLFVGRL